jgi:hypothetical protein
MITAFEQLIGRAISQEPRRAVALLPSTPQSLRGALLAHERGVARRTLIGHVGAIVVLATFCRLLALHLLVGGQVPVLLCSPGDAPATWLAGLALAVSSS